jgi:hypothetical protein
MPTWEQIGSFINTGGGAILLAVALIGGWKGWWVYGSTHRECMKDRDFWRDIALRGLNVAEKATHTAARRAGLKDDD